MIFNQFEEFGNYLWHYEVTGHAMEEVVKQVSRPGRRVPRHGLRHRFGRDDRQRRLHEAGLPGQQDRRQRSAAVPDPAGERLRRAPHRGHRRQARAVDPQRPRTPTWWWPSTTTPWSTSPACSTKQPGAQYLVEQGRAGSDRLATGPAGFLRHLQRADARSRSPSTTRWASTTSSSPS